MEDIESQQSNDDAVLYQSPIADPLATEKLTAKLLTLVKKCKQYNLNNSIENQISKKRSKRS